jgi:glutamine amidotransferase
MITIIDYGMGNPRSIQNMLKRIGSNSEITSEKNKILNSSKIILPGVGAFDPAMQKINDLGIREVLDLKANKEKIPVLGICLGMQLLTKSSEEGSLPGLGWISAETKKFNLEKDYKVPHMGWNSIKLNSDNRILSGMDDSCRYYFVHSYYVQVEKSENSILTCNYGMEFDAGINSGNIYGFQFHPEKSHKFGKQLLENFIKLC